MIYPFFCHWAFRVFPAFASMTRAAMRCVCAEVFLRSASQGSLATSAALRAVECSAAQDNARVLSKARVPVDTPTSYAEKIL